MQIEPIQHHGHEVLEMMLTSGQSYNDGSLEQAIHQNFGTEARFYICSGSGMTAAELIAALRAKRKFSGTEEAYTFDPANRCNH